MHDNKERGGGGSRETEGTELIKGKPVGGDEYPMNYTAKKPDVQFMKAV
jgi:hypothetical protein